VPPGRLSAAWHSTRRRSSTRSSRRLRPSSRRTTWRRTSSSRSCCGWDTRRRTSAARWRCRASAPRSSAGAPTSWCASPGIVVETKRITRRLREEDANQALSHAQLLEPVAPFAILTNGRDWEQYTLDDEAIGGHAARARRGRGRRRRVRLRDVPDRNPPRRSRPVPHPRQIIAFMVDVADIRPGERVLDLACGSGGFLIRAFQRVRKQLRSRQLDRDERKELEHRLVHDDLWGSRSTRGWRRSAGSTSSCTATATSTSTPATPSASGTSRTRRAGASTWRRSSAASSRSST